MIRYSGAAMKPYSQDLRDKIIAALETDEYSQTEVAEIFGVSLSFVQKLIRRWRKTGSNAARPHGGGVKRVLEAYQQQLRTEVKNQPDISLNELCEKIKQSSGVFVSLSQISRELKLLQLPRKKSRSTTVSEKLSV